MNSNQPAGESSTTLVDVESSGMDSGGWSTIYQTVREADEDKVKGCKEDIDTLLVFAGLYSGILTGFLVQTYQILQPNPMDELVALLRQSLVQNAVVSGTMHGTAASNEASPVSSVTFEPPGWALQVNGLWFASLVCSLASASISMLVKQWLREYLAVQWISPQERLRARQYRNPGLDEWKVLEIAAMLPILLHISLGMFFIGLCIFTAAVDKRIGHSTLPLVLAWAFFVIVTLVAPLFSPRCPYKVALLKTTLHAMRRVIVSRLFKALAFLSEAVLKVRSNWAHSLAEKLVDDEGDAVHTAQKDIEILLAVDEVIVDDGLLRVMWETLKQNELTLRAPIDFILGAIKHRLGDVGVEGVQETDSEHSIPSSIDLRRMSKRMWITTMNILAESYHRNLGPHVGGDKTRTVQLSISDPNM